MNTYDDDDEPYSGGSDLGDLARCDDTLDTGDAGSDPQGPLQKRWLMEQRFVHGLLRAMHTSDAQGRQTRIEAILAALPRRRRPVLLVRLALAAAAAVVVAGGAWYLAEAFASRPAPVQALPQPEHLVERALASLREDVDRRYELSIHASDPALDQKLPKFTVTMRPGRRYLIEGSWPEGSGVHGPFRAGCDGKVWWWGKLQMPLEKPSRFPLLGDVLDVGYLDLETILQNLPKDFELRSVRREPPAVPGGDALIRLEATRLPERMGNRVREAFFLVEEGSGIVRHVEMHTGGRAGLVERSITFRYEGIVQRKAEDYSPPK